MARGEVKEAVGQGSSPMREALCLRLKDGAVWEVVLAARCLEWRARASLDFPPPFEEQNFPFWECGIAVKIEISKCSSRVGFSLLQPLLPWQCTCVAVGRH